MRVRIRGVSEFHEKIVILHSRKFISLLFTVVLFLIVFNISGEKRIVLQNSRYYSTLL